jgi:dienelactone hydrolase
LALIDFKFNVNSPCLVLIFWSLFVQKISTKQRGIVMSLPSFLKSLSISTSFTLMLLSSLTTSVVASSFSPPFSEVKSYSTTIRKNNDIADIYYPNPSDLGSGRYSFPAVLLLQGALVDKSFYSDYARQVARYGFVVVVPNHFRPFPILPGNPPALLAETSQVNAVLQQLKVENSSSSAPIAGRIDVQNFGLLGHSFGGAVGLSVIASQYLEFLCREPFDRPPELLAGAFFGTSLRDQTTNAFIPINNDGIGIALLQGERDGVALPNRAVTTFENIQTPPKLLVSIAGTNHFGITNVNNPVGAQPDLSTSTLEQRLAIETIARWSGLFLRSSLLNDQHATDYIFSTGDQLDPNASVTTAAIPEPSTIGGLLTVTIFGFIYRRKTRKVA